MRKRNTYFLALLAILLLLFLAFGFGEKGPDPNYPKVDVMVAKKNGELNKQIIDSGDGIVLFNLEPLPKDEDEAKKRLEELKRFWLNTQLAYKKITEEEVILTEKGLVKGVVAKYELIPRLGLIPWWAM